MGGGGMTVFDLWGIEYLRIIGAELCGNVGPLASLATGPRGLLGSFLSEGSLGLVIAATSLLHSGTEDEPPGAPSIANLTEDCLTSLLFDNVLGILNPIEAFAVTDLPMNNLCDTRLLRPRDDLVLDPRHSFEEPGNSEESAESMSGENSGLKALGVSGNVWLLSERADSGVCTVEASCAPAERSKEISQEDPGLAESARCLDRRVPLRSAKTMLSSRSGLEGGLGEPDRLGKPPLVNPDEMSALSGN